MFQSIGYEHHFDRGQSGSESSVVSEPRVRTLYPEAIPEDPPQAADRAAVRVLSSAASGTFVGYRPFCERHVNTRRSLQPRTPAILRQNTYRCFTPDGYRGRIQAITGAYKLFGVSQKSWDPLNRSRRPRHDVRGRHV